MIHQAEAVPADAFELVLREEDAQEVTEGWRERVAACIATVGAVAFRDATGALLGLGGVVHVNDHSISPWMLCSAGIREHARDIWRAAKCGVSHLHGFTGHALVFNHIPKKSHSNRRFIQRLGFHIIPSPDGEFDLFYLPPNV
jgi:hypothetical protein